jgi:hypothetical protein
MSLDRIEITPFVVIAGEILQNRRSGSLTIVRGSVRKVLLVLIVSSVPEEWLGDFLVRRGVITADRAVTLLSDDPIEVVARFHESGLLDLSARQTLLREWTAAQFVPLFSLDEGNAAFAEEEPLPPEKRVFLQSTAALVLEGIRSITNGLVLRRSLGDLKRDIEMARNGRFAIDAIALTDGERHIAQTLHEPTTIETFLKHFASESVIAAKVVIGMLALGVFAVVEHRAVSDEVSFDDMQRDLELLAAIGSSDHRSLRTVALSRQLPQLDHYQVLDVPRAATRAQIISAADAMKRNYDPTTYPPIVREAVTSINRRIDEAVAVLKEAGRRASYDKLIQRKGDHTEATINQRLQQQSIAEQNLAKAKELITHSDYYGAIVLLKQCVNFAPEKSEAWMLLGSCQERNPKWRRDAAESFQKALSIDPNNVEAMVSLGDLYRSEGMASRAQACYEDALKIAPEHQQATSRLKAMKKGR